MLAEIYLCHACSDQAIARGAGEVVAYFDQYLTSLYWGMTTMTTVGYGDISASTSAEKVRLILMPVYDACLMMHRARP
jgi:hypothetical protein